MKNNLKFMKSKGFVLFGTILLLTASSAGCSSENKKVETQKKAMLPPPPPATTHAATQMAVEEVELPNYPAAQKEYHPMITAALWNLKSLRDFLPARTFEAFRKFMVDPCPDIMKSVFDGEGRMALFMNMPTLMASEDNLYFWSPNKAEVARVRAHFTDAREWKGGILDRKTISRCQLIKTTKFASFRPMAITMGSNRALLQHTEKMGYDLLSTSPREYLSLLTFDLESFRSRTSAPVIGDVTYLPLKNALEHARTVEFLVANMGDSLQAYFYFKYPETLPQEAVIDRDVSRFYKYIDANAIVWSVSSINGWWGSEKQTVLNTLSGPVRSFYENSYSIMDELGKLLGDVLRISSTDITSLFYVNDSLDTVVAIEIKPSVRPEQALRKVHKALRKFFRKKKYLTLSNNVKVRIRLGSLRDPRIKGYTLTLQYLYPGKGKAGKHHGKKRSKTIKGAMFVKDNMLFVAVPVLSPNGLLDRVLNPTGLPVSKRIIGGNGYHRVMEFGLDVGFVSKIAVQFSQLFGGLIPQAQLAKLKTTTSTPAIVVFGSGYDDSTNSLELLRVRASKGAFELLDRWIP